MKEYSKIFVSYTTRDGLVTPKVLKLVESNLQEICSPFIHAVAPNSKEITQFGVMKKLLSSHILILIESPSISRSPWVKLELLFAKLMLMPVIRLNIETISSTIGKRLTKSSTTLVPRSDALTHAG